MRIAWPISEAERPHLLRFVGATTAVVVLFATLHDQWLIRFAPEHFTLYHPAIFPTDSLTLIALGFALLASFGPALVLGAALWAAARLGPRPPVSLAHTIPLLGLGLIVAECVALSIGALCGNRFEAHATLCFPERFYPELRADLVAAQSTQITLYFCAAALAVALPAHLWLHRRRLARPETV